MKYCTQCGTEYRQEIERCADCPEAGWSLDPPQVGAWSAEEAGWQVVMGTEDREGIDEASGILEEIHLAHLLLKKQPNGSYLPLEEHREPGKDTPAVRPLLFDIWDEPWLLVVPRPMHARALAALKAAEEPDEEGPQAEDTDPHAGMADDPTALPWEKPTAPISRQRKAFAVLFAGVIGFGSGLFLLRRYQAAIPCMLLQMVILMPALPDVQPDPLFTWVHLIGRTAELVLAIRSLIRL